MQHVCQTPSELRDRLRGTDTVGFVPTMGALHDGHLALVNRALLDHQTVVVSIFVNPTQFGPSEDFSNYPRTLDYDVAFLTQSPHSLEKKILVFTPTVTDLYGPSIQTSTVVNVPELESLWCGKTRPGHFQGVASVVLRLLNMVRPDSLYMGEKDFQQLVLIQKMVQDLWVGVQVLGCPIVRESDGLALSSRNRYLSSSQRKKAPQLYRQLLKIKSRFEEGERDVEKLVDNLDFSGFELEYCAVVDSLSLQPLFSASRGNRVLLAAKLGTTRLIDNIAL